MRSLLVTFLTFLIVHPLLAQQMPQRCHVQEAIGRMETMHPGYRPAAEKTFRQAFGHVQEGSRTNDIYRIPVVFHVVYNTTEENVPDSLMHSQIEVLNEDFRRMNADASETRQEFLPVAADARIEFVLASTDPDGMPTSGITRTQTDVTEWITFTEFIPDGIKRSADGGADAWDTQRYLNIWVANLSFFDAPFMLGYAYPPVDSDNWPAGSQAPDPSLEGVVVHYEVFGRDNPLGVGLLETNNRGRTCTHEVGHYLGLRHTWGDGGGFTGQDGCTVDDGINDTPNCAEAQQQQCNLSSNTCTDSPSDLPDMIENFMDYSDERCTNTFTQGQVDIMRAVLETTRSELVEDIVSSLSDREGFAPQISMFPNPSSGRMTVRWDAQGDRPRMMELTDAMGKRIMEHAITAKNGTEFSFDLTGLPDGIYHARLSTDRWNDVQRIVLLH